MRNLFIALLVCSPFISNAQSDTSWKGWWVVPNLTYKKVNDSIVSVSISGNPKAVIKDLIEYTADLNEQLAAAREVFYHLKMAELVKQLKNPEFTTAVKDWIKISTELRKKYEYGIWKSKYQINN